MKPQSFAIPSDGPSLDFIFERAVEVPLPASIAKDSAPTDSKPSRASAVLRGTVDYLDEDDSDDQRTSQKKGSERKSKHKSIKMQEAVILSRRLSKRSSVIRVQANEDLAHLHVDEDYFAEPPSKEEAPSNAALDVRTWFFCNCCIAYCVSTVLDSAISIHCTRS